MIKKNLQFDLIRAFWSMNYEPDFTKYGVCKRKPKIKTSFISGFFLQKVMSARENSILGPYWVPLARFRAKNNFLGKLVSFTILFILALYHCAMFQEKILKRFRQLVRLQLNISSSSIFAVKTFCCALVIIN